MKKEPELDRYFYIAGWICLFTLGLGILADRLLGGEVWERIPRCFFHLATGYYCPGCGGTRALRELLKGHFLRSWYFNPFVGYVAWVGGWFMISHTIEHLSRRRIAIGLHFRQVYMWVGIFIIFANCLIKNVVKLIWGISLMS